MGEKITLPDEPIPQTSEPDSLSFQESRAFKEENDLEREATENQHSRREGVRDQIVILLTIWLYVAAAGLIVTTGIWMFHLIAPVDFRWLAPEELTSVKEALTNIVVGAVFGFLIKGKYL